MKPTPRGEDKYSSNCWVCGREGHISRDCKQKKLFCYSCGKPGNTVKYCECRKAKKPTESGKRRLGLRDKEPRESGISPVVAGNANTETSASSTFYMAKVGVMSSLGERCFVNIQLLGHSFDSLIDTGSDRSYLGSIGWNWIRTVGMNIQELNEPRKVQLADGSTTDVLGFVEVPTILEGEPCILKFFILPELSVDSILGLDALRRLGVIIDVAKKTWHFSSDPSRVFGFLNSHEARQKCEATSFHSSSLVQLSQGQKQTLEVFLSKQLPLFDEVSGRTDRVQHRIDVGDAPPVKQRYYPISPARRDIIHAKVDEMLSEGIIEPSNSLWASPIVLVKKPSGDFRLCVDFRKVNLVTKRDSYPLPYMENILSKLREARYISTIDLKNGYWQVPLEDSSKPITAFTVPERGLFQFKVLPFGLHNAPATFQRLMDEVLREEMGTKCFCYLDDIVLVSETYEEHLSSLARIFNKLRSAGLRINKEKSFFCRQELRYLGHVVSPAGIGVDPEKVECILQYPVPKNLKQLRSFLGLISWYRRFIPNFSNFSAPLTQLLKKNQRWDWSEEAQKAFEEFKSCLVKAPILSCPDFSKPFHLQTDASFSGIGAVLTQDYEGNEKVIAYASRILTEAEKKFSVTEKELLAILWSIRKFRPYLEGYTFVVITDHFALKWLHKLQNPSGRLARWALELQEYDFTVVHRKGNLHKVPDALSRIPELWLGAVEFGTADFENITDQWYLKRLKQVQDFPNKWSDWRVQDGRLYHLRLNPLGNVLQGDIEKWKLVIPSNLKLQLLKEFHDTPTAGHLGIAKTYYRTCQDCYWPKQFRDVVSYVRSCEVCQSHKVEQKAPAGLMGKKVPGDPWVTVSVDLLGPYPRSKNGHKFCLVFQDSFTKWVEARPLRNATTKLVTEAFRQLILRWGAPKYLICDNGTQFTSKAFQDLAKAYHVVIRFTTPYTPQSNPTERVNRVLKTMMSSYLGKVHDTWDEYLPEFVHAMNSAVHEATGFSPSYLNLGREVQLQSVIIERQDEPDIQPVVPKEWAEKLSKLKDVYSLVKENLDEAYRKNKHYYNLRRRDVKFVVGQPVMRRNFILSSGFRKFTSGLAPTYVGPFVVSKKVSPLVYELKDQNGSKCGTWHVKDLKAFNQRP